MTPRLVLLSEVAFDGGQIPGDRPRGLLALLAAQLGPGCDTARLVAELWPGEPPKNPVKALQVVVSRTRARIGPEVVAGTATGYRLALPAEEVDAAAVLLRASEAAERLRAGDPAGALAAAERGLALVPGGGTGSTLPTGDPLGDLRAARVGTRAELLRNRALALARLGRSVEAIDLLEPLGAASPHDEELLVELLRSEAAVHGPAVAIIRYERYRRELADDLGTDPGAALREEHARLLAESAPVRRHGVAAEPNALLGRDADVAAVLGLLRTARVATVVGPGGLGKTRLAHAVAGRAEQRTVHVVGLAGVEANGTPGAVAAEVASALGTGVPGGRAPRPGVAGLLDALGSGPVLLVLDNCEHVLDDAAALVHELVARSRELRVLTTSRAPLGLSSEAVHPLPQLDPAATVALFTARARAARPDVELPAAEVEDLCARLDGLPLAVELAAARVRVLTVPEIARRLDDRFALLRGGARDAPARHRTLHAVVDWSWNLLDEPARAALRTLSALPGGFTAATAERILDDPAALDLLGSLVDQSLVALSTTDPAGGARFRMLETVREFAAERRVAAGETEAVTARLLDWGTAFGLALHGAPFGDSPRRDLARIRPELDNLLHVLRLALDRHDPETLPSRRRAAAAVAAVLGALWMVESNTARMLALGEQTLPLLSRSRPADPADREALRQALVQYAAIALLTQGPTAVRPLAVLRRLPAGPADTSMGAFARVLTVLPDVDALAALCEGPPLVAASALAVVGYVLEERGDLDGALASVRRMVSQLTPGPPWFRLFAQSRLGELCLLTERHGEALTHLTAAHRAIAAFGVGDDLIQLRLAIVLAHLGLGAPGEAERVLATVEPPVDAVEALSFDVATRAELALAKGEIETGLRGWRRSAALLAGSGGTWLGPWASATQAMAVVAHVRAHRLDEVTGLADGLPAVLDRLLAAERVPAPICGTVLLALGLVEVERGRTVRGAWLVALAERFHYLREYQPTMSSAAARALVVTAAGPTYSEAVAEYAGLSREDLWAAARELAAAYRERV